MIYLCDLDGTICDITHRLHYIQGANRDWPRFFKECVNDEPIPEVIETIQCLRRGGAYIFCVSGRSDEVRTETTQWLAKWSVPYDALYMRKAGDYRADHIVKKELLTQIQVESSHGKIVGVFDDRRQVVDMWRAEGLKCFQVAEGNY